MDILAHSKSCESDHTSLFILGGVDDEASSFFKYIETVVGHSQISVSCGILDAPHRQDLLQIGRL